MQNQRAADRWTPAVHRRAPFWIGFVLVALVALAVIATGGAQAADVEVHNETITVDADTSTVWAELNNTNPTTNASVTVTFSGISNGTETQIGTSTVWVDNQTTKLVESPAINGTANDSVRVVATVDNTTVPSSNVTVTSGAFQQVEGGTGTGGGLGGTELGIGAVAVLGIGAVLLLGGRDD